MFDPKTNRFPYPEQTDQHYLKVKKNNGLVFDENYDFVDNHFFFKFKRFFVRILLAIIVFPITKIRLGLKVNGKENLKKYKNVIKKGVISCANHVHLWDYLMISRTIRYIHPRVLVWAPNIRGETGGLMRLVGGIPIPDDSKKGTLKLLTTIEQMMERGEWLHIYPEGSMWEYYQPIRPFKTGAAYFAIKTNRPIMPFAFSYREPSWIRKHIFKQIAVFTLNVGKPIYKDDSLPLREQELDLTKRMHDEICKLSGVDPKESLYEPVFNNSKRIDYYTDKYGVGYKGSH